jgi:hypothetical protein
LEYQPYYNITDLKTFPFENKGEASLTFVVGCTILPILRSALMFPLSQRIFFASYSFPKKK